jgi:uncharacterized membrane protein YgcG
VSCVNIGFEPRVNLGLVDVFIETVFLAYFRVEMHKLGSQASVARVERQDNVRARLRKAQEASKAEAKRESNNALIRTATYCYEDNSSKTYAAYLRSLASGCAARFLVVGSLEDKSCPFSRQCSSLDDAMATGAAIYKRCHFDCHKFEGFFFEKVYVYLGDPAHIPVEKRMRSVPLAVVSDSRSHANESPTWTFLPLDPRAAARFEAFALVKTLQESELAPPAVQSEPPAPRDPVQSAPIRRSSSPSSQSSSSSSSSSSSGSSSSSTSGSASGSSSSGSSGSGSSGSESDDSDEDDSFVASDNSCDDASSDTSYEPTDKDSDSESEPESESNESNDKEEPAIDNASTVAQVFTDVSEQPKQEDAALTESLQTEALQTEPLLSEPRSVQADGDSAVDCVPLVNAPPPVDAPLVNVGTDACEPACGKRKRSQSP